MRELVRYEKYSRKDIHDFFCQIQILHHKQDLGDYME